MKQSEAIPSFGAFSPLALELRQPNSARARTTRAHTRTATRVVASRRVRARRAGTRGAPRLAKRPRHGRELWRDVRATSGARDVWRFGFVTSQTSERRGLKKLIGQQRRTRARHATLRDVTNDHVTSTTSRANDVVRSSRTVALRPANFDRPHLNGRTAHDFETRREMARTWRQAACQMTSSSPNRAWRNRTRRVLPRNFFSEQAGDPNFAPPIGGELLCPTLHITSLRLRRNCLWVGLATFSDSILTKTPRRGAPRRVWRHKENFVVVTSLILEILPKNQFFPKKNAVASPLKVARAPATTTGRPTVRVTSEKNFVVVTSSIFEILPKNRIFPEKNAVASPLEVARAPATTTKRPRERVTSQKNFVVVTLSVFEILPNKRNFRWKKVSCDVTDARKRRGGAEAGRPATWPTSSTKRLRSLPAAVRGIARKPSQKCSKGNRPFFTNG